MKSKVITDDSLSTYHVFMADASKQARGKKAPLKKLKVQGEVCYDVLAIRQDGKAYSIDHIPSGLKIGDLPTYQQAHEAVVELIQIDSFKFKKLSARAEKRLTAEVKAVFARLRQPRETTFVGTAKATKKAKVRV